MKVVTYFSTLCKLAREEYDAKKNGTPEEARAAEERHSAYKQRCLEADEMVIFHSRT